MCMHNYKFIRKKNTAFFFQNEQRSFLIPSNEKREKVITEKHIKYSTKFAHNNNVHEKCIQSHQIT